MAGFKHTVRFVLQQTSKGSKSTALRCFVRYNNTRSVFASGVYIEPRYWNPKNQEPRQTVSLLDGENIKADLSNVKKWIKQAFDKITSETGMYPPTPIKVDGKFVDPLKEACTILIDNKGAIPGDETTARTLSFFNYIDQLIANSKSGKRTKKDGSRIAEGTIRAYNSAYGVLKRYSEHKKSAPFTFDDINLAFYYDLKDFAYNIEHLSDNYFGATIKFLKTCMTESKEEKLHSNDEHNHKRFIKVQVEVENIYLDEKQLNLLAQLDLSKNLKLDRVRDLFLVGCWTGLRFSDFTNIKSKNFQGDFIEIKTQKTGEMVAIPIHKTIKSIVVKYAGVTANSLPPAISNAKLNEYIKEVGEEAKFLDLVSLEKSKAGKKIIYTLPLHKLISTHTARRAFASNMFRMGIPTFAIMAVTGHTTEKAFFKYIKVTPREKAEIMREIWQRQAMTIVKSENTISA